VFGRAGRTAKMEFAAAGGNIRGDGRSGFDFARIGQADSKKNELNHLKTFHKTFVVINQKYSK
jgi:hypothetical protein